MRAATGALRVWQSIILDTKTGDALHAAISPCASILDARAERNREGKEGQCCGKKHVVFHEFGPGIPGVGVGNKVLADYVIAISDYSIGFPSPWTGKTNGSDW